MKRIGIFVSVLLLLACSSCSTAVNQTSYPKEIKNLDQLKQFRLLWEEKTKYEGFTIKKDAMTGKTSFEQGVQFMSGDWDYDFINRQTLQKAIDEEKIRTFFNFIPFYKKIEKILKKDVLDPAKLVVNWNMGINVEDGLNRFQNLVKDCLQEMPLDTADTANTAERLKEQKSKFQELAKIMEEMRSLHLQQIQLDMQILEKKAKKENISILSGEIEKLDKQIKALEKQAGELEKFFKKSLPPLLP